jgi:hypothetical protein
MKERGGISEEFIGKKRHGIPFEGYAPKDMTEEELQRVNSRWEHFYRTKKKDLARLTRDEDLMSIGLLSVRRMLCLDPECSDGLLIQQAKFDILSSLRWGQSIDSRKRRAEGLDIAPTGREDFPFCTPDDTTLEDEVHGKAIKYNGSLDRGERVLIDNLQYQAFWNSLTELEQQLVTYLKEETADEPRWYQGEYVKVERHKGHARQRFLEATGVSNKQYTRTYARLRLKFYEHFGTEDERKRERKWFETWKPAHSLHPEKQEGYLRRK